MDNISVDGIVGGTIKGVINLPKSIIQNTTNTSENNIETDTDKVEDDDFY